MQRALKLAKRFCGRHIKEWQEDEEVLAALCKHFQQHDAFEQVSCTAFENSFRLTCRTCEEHVTVHKYDFTPYTEHCKSAEHAARVQAVEDNLISSSKRVMPLPPRALEEDEHDEMYLSKKRKMSQTVKPAITGTSKNEDVQLSVGARRNRTSYTTSRDFHLPPSLSPAEPSFNKGFVPLLTRPPLSPRSPPKLANHLSPLLLISPKRRTLSSSDAQDMYNEMELDNVQRWTNDQPDGNLRMLRDEEDPYMISKHSNAQSDDEHEAGFASTTPSEAPLRWSLKPDLNWKSGLRKLRIMFQPIDISLGESGKDMSEEIDFYLTSISLHALSRQKLSQMGQRVRRHALFDPKSEAKLEVDLDILYDGYPDMVVSESKQREDMSFQSKEMLFADMGEEQKRAFVHNQNLSPGQQPISSSIYTRNSAFGFFQTQYVNGEHTFKHADKIWACGKCGKMFGRTARDQHEAEECQVREKLTCSQCHDTFSSTHALSIHQKSGKCLPYAEMGPKNRKFGNVQKKKDIKIAAGIAADIDQLECDHWEKGCRKVFTKTKSSVNKKTAIDHGDRIHITKDRTYAKCTSTSTSECVQCKKEGPKKFL